MPRAALSCLLALVFGLLCLPGALQAATPKKEPLAPTIASGDVFTVTFPTEKGKPKDKITFEETTFSVGSLGALKFPYKQTRRSSKKTSETEFSGTVTDAMGTVIEVSGKVTDDGEIHGSITTRPKDNDPTARNFNGTQANAPAKKK
jgi:hypothetical protein